MASRIVVAILVLAGIAAGIYFLVRERLQPPPYPPVSAAPAPPPQAAEPKYPIGVEPKPLPKLGESDPAILEALSGLVDPKAIARTFDLEDTVRRIVATVDNLPRETIARRINPVKPVGGLFITTGKDESLAIGPKNAARYEPLVRLAESVDAKKLVATYVYFYPLFQEAYVNLGYPTAYFNDRLVEVIDHLLEAPEPKGPVKLVTPHVLYEYADPELESLSAGQKILVRVGNEKAARLKAKLREIRSELVEKGKLSG